MNDFFLHYQRSPDCVFDIGETVHVIDKRDGATIHTGKLLKVEWHPQPYFDENDKLATKQALVAMVWGLNAWVPATCLRKVKNNE
jgi:hypothetical protein